MDMRDVRRSLGLTVDPKFEIDFTEDIKELQEIDRSWAGVYVGTEPEAKETGSIWWDMDSHKTFMYDGEHWIEIKTSEV